MQDAQQMQGDDDHDRYARKPEYDIAKHMYSPFASKRPQPRHNQGGPAWPIL